MAFTSHRIICVCLLSILLFCAIYASDIDKLLMIQGSSLTKLIWLHDITVELYFKIYSMGPWFWHQQPLYQPSTTLFPPSPSSWPYHSGMFTQYQRDPWLKEKNDLIKIIYFCVCNDACSCNDDSPGLFVLWFGPALRP